MGKHRSAEQSMDTSAGLQMSGAHPDLGYMRSTRPHPLGGAELLITVELGSGAALAWPWKLITAHRATGQRRHVGPPPTPVLREL